MKNGNFTRIYLFIHRCRSFYLASFSFSFDFYITIFLSVKSLLIAFFWFYTLSMFFFVKWWEKHFFIKRMWNYLQLLDQRKKWFHLSFLTILSFFFTASKGSFINSPFLIFFYSISFSMLWIFLPFQWQNHHSLRNFSVPLMNFSNNSSQTFHCIKTSNTSRRCFWCLLIHSAQQMRFLWNNHMNSIKLFFSSLYLLNQWCSIHFCFATHYLIKICSTGH